MKNSELILYTTHLISVLYHFSNDDGHFGDGSLTAHLCIKQIKKWKIQSTH